MRDPKHATTLAALRALYALLEPPERWTHRTITRDVHDSATRTAWCLTCGLCAVIRRGIVRKRVYRLLLNCTGERDAAYALQLWSNAPERTHADVLALIQAAIERECLAVGA